MLKYDFIILGCGAAGLSLAMRMIGNDYFHDKRILLIDKDRKTNNDRTWCFWENKKGFFENVVHKKWNELSFYAPALNIELDIHPYEYKMIRGIDFYNHCLARIRQTSNIDIIYGEVRSVETNGSDLIIHLSDRNLQFAPATVFNSLYKPDHIEKGELQLLQHFKGWIVETESVAFNPGRATLMDFRVHQRYGTSFIYVLPLSSNRALIEYTLFTPTTLEKSQYDAELASYISEFLGLKDYRVTEEEFGIIPMTNDRFKQYEKGMYNIGIVGGQTKPSTGYTFQFIQKQSQAITDCLIQNKPLSTIGGQPKRFNFYDNVLLELLVSKKLGGREIFSRLFERNKASTIFKFLDNGTKLPEELKLISTLQKGPFLKAAIQLASR